MCVSALKKLSKSADDEVKGTATGALWRIEGESKYLQESKKTGGDTQAASSKHRNGQKLLFVAKSKLWKIVAKTSVI